MKKRNRIVFAAVFSLCSSLCMWGGAKWRGFNRPPQQASLPVPSSPEIVVPFHTLALAVDNPTGTFPYGQQLRASIDKELTGAFSTVPSGAEGSLTVSVLEFTQPTARSFSVMEQRAVANNNANNTNNNNKKGWQGVLDSLSAPAQKVPVQYWEAQGEITLKSVLKDKGGSSIDETVLRVPFDMKRELAVNGVVSVDQNSLPQQDAILGFLLQEGARKVRHRYAFGLVGLAVRLPVDNELLAGNQLAQQGHWEAALQAWQKASLRSNQADQQFCLALANYALAFKAFAELQDSDAAYPRLNEGARLLAEAERSDPNEKYFKEVETWVAAAKTEMDKAGRQAKALALRRSRGSDSNDLASSPSGGKDLGLAPDTPQASEFRNYIRLQWKNRTQPPADADDAALQNTGTKVFKLTPDQSRAVVAAETTAWKERKANQDLYFEQFKSFLQGGFLSAEARTQLRKVSNSLGLTQDEVAAVESRIAFREEGKPRTAPRR